MPVVVVPLTGSALRVLSCSAKMTSYLLQRRQTPQFVLPLVAEKVRSQTSLLPSFLCEVGSGIRTLVSVFGGARWLVQRRCLAECEA